MKRLEVPPLRNFPPIHILRVLNESPSHTRKIHKAVRGSLTTLSENMEYLEKGKFVYRIYDDFLIVWGITEKGKNLLSKATLLDSEFFDPNPAYPEAPQLIKKEGE